MPSAGYSGTPLAKKLGIIAGRSQRILLVGAPEGFEALLEGLPADAGVSRRAPAKGCPDVIIAFVTRTTELERIERIPTGRLVQTHKRGPRERDTQMLPQQAMRRPNAQPAEPEPPQALLRKRPLQP